MATALENDFPDIVETQPGLIAHHDTEGGKLTQATLRELEEAAARTARHSEQLWMSEILRLKTVASLSGEADDPAAAEIGVRR